MAPAFSKSADFAINKPAGQPCPNLQTDFRCGIHDRLRDKGFPGCVVFDCFGAGQKVAQVTFHGRDWRSDPSLSRAMFDSFAVMRHLHELLWYLNESATVIPEAAQLRDEIAALTLGSPEQLAQVDIDSFRRRTNELSTRASESARKGLNGQDYRGKDLIGVNMRGANLRGASLRGAYLIGTDLREADLRLADVIGADMRGADIRGANLSTTIFLIQSQLDAARGDTRTKLPKELGHPPHWSH